jgi:hypothetical protein
MPSTAANAINRSAKVDRVSEIHFNAQLAFLAMQGTSKGGSVQVEILSSELLTGLDGIEQVCTPGRVLDICVDQERVRLGVDVLHHDLESVEELCFGALDFG